MPSLPYRPDREDHWRWSLSDDPAAKEWQHVIVFGPGFDLLVNFSLQRRAAETVVRVIVLLRAACWTGFVDTAAGAEVVVSPDGREVRAGAHVFRIGPAGYRFVIDVPARDVFVDLALEPASLPMIARRHQIARARRLDWLMVPRLRARGEVLFEGACVTLDDAPAYHDHNWGAFRWGDDFSWDWAIVTPDDPRAPWTAVYSALRNRAGTALTLRQAFLWHRAHNVLAASGDDVQAATAGRLAVTRPHRLPAALSLLRQPGGTDVPAAVTLHAEHPAGWLDLELDVRSVSQILVPSDTDPLGTVVLSECAAGARAQGRLHDRRFHWTGHGILELLAA